MRTLPLHRLSILYFCIAVLTAVLSHPGRGHCQESITPLTAAQIGLQHVGGMIAAGRLDPGWAADLRAMNVYIRNIKGFAEYVVHLTRSNGQPAELSIYLNMVGGFSGSSLGDHGEEAQDESGY